MSLYRQPGRLSRAAIAAALLVGLLVGGIGGYLVGNGGEEEPSLSEAVAELERDAEPLRLALQQVEIEYGGTVRDGEVVSPTEYEASVATAERAIATLAELRGDLRLILGEARFRRLALAVESLRALLRGRVPETRIAAAVTAADEALGPLGGR